MTEVVAALLKEELTAFLRERGAALVGVGDLSDFPEAIYPTGVSVAVPVPRGIVHDLKNAPTAEYLDMYHALNSKLNDIVEEGAAFLAGRGYYAYAQTTHVVPWDRESLVTAMPHKTVATRAGLGWIGKSCLLVTREYGGAVRISSLLTNAPLPCDQPISESRCGKCQKCVENCPGQALRGTNWTAGMDRDALVDAQQCMRTQTQVMKAATGLEADICGKCFAVCPYTQNYLKEDLT